MNLQFAVNSYESRVPDASAQRLVNYFAEALPPDAKSPVLLLNSPGISSFATGFSGAVRGMLSMDGVLYVVAGSALYSVTAAGAAVVLGSINTTLGYVSMASNRASPRQLCFVDGSDGWIYDTTGGLQQIVDGDFAAADTVTFIDGYFVFNETATSRFFVSNIDNGLAYTATDFADAEGHPDNAVAVRESHRELWVFGDESIEVYTNTGNADFPFERIQGAYLERGCGAPFSIAGDDNTLFWVGNDGVVYRAAGYTPTRISTHAIEEQIRKFSSFEDAYGFFATISGHKLYHLVFPTGQAAFVYDAATGLWHERESFGQKHWRAGAYVRAFNKDIVGDAFQGRLGVMDMDVFTEFGAVMQSSATSPVIDENRQRVFHFVFELDMETGVGGSADPEIWLDWSDNGGRTWSARKPARSMGKIGEYGKRIKWNRLGSSRSRVYRVTTAADVKRSIIAARLESAVGMA